MERDQLPDPALAAGAYRLPPVRRYRSGAALAGLLAGAALASVACSGNPHPVSTPAPPAGAVSRGTASWYGSDFDGRRTASGERYDKHNLTAAHPSLPFGTLVQVENLDNGRKVVVRINDRGPFKHRRVIDLSYAAAHEIRMVGAGTARVELTVLGRNDPRYGWPPGPETLLAAAPGASAVPAAPAAAGSPERSTPGPAPAERSATAPGSPGSATVPAPAERLAQTPAPTAGFVAPQYTVQVGAFGEVARAEALQQDLARRYPETAVHSDGIWSRVQVGLFDDRDRAETLREELASQGIAAIVVAAR